MEEQHDRQPDEHIEPSGGREDTPQADGRPTQAEPAQGQPTQAEPAQGQPTQAEPAQGQPSQAQPPQGQPLEGQPPQSPPHEGEPAQGQPAQGAVDAGVSDGVEGEPVSIPAVVQVEFKGERRSYFINARKLPIGEGDYVVVQVERGRDTGKVVRCGDVLEKIPHIRPVKQEVLRKASEEDMRKWEENKRKEEEARRVCEEKIASHGLKMKLVEVEYQLDGTKITFFFTADERVDFRELVKDLAGIYKTRIELRQIGVRDEAKRLGGYGSCGRKYCCTTFLQEFEPVTLRMARDQRLSLSPTKISGACGRLMCCLAYEREYYMEVARQLPKVGRKLVTPYGEVTVTKIDIFAQAVIAEDENGEEMRLTLEQFRKATQAQAVSPEGKEPGAEEQRGMKPDRGGAEPVGRGDGDAAAPEGADAERQDGEPEAGRPGDREPESGEGK